MMIAAGEFRAAAARCQERADMTAKLALRGAYRQLAVEYMKLAMQQETIERLHALIGRLDADAPARSKHWTRGGNAAFIGCKSVRQFTTCSWTLRDSKQGLEGR